MRVNVLNRFVAYACFGCLLLLIYEIVFMTRTSADRDWNHFHNSRYTLQSLERSMLKNCNESRLNDTIKQSQGFPYGDSGPLFPSAFKDVRYRSKKMSKRSLSFVRKVSINGVETPLAPLSDVIAFDSDLGIKEMMVPSSRVMLRHLTENRTIENEVSDAIDAQKNILGYIVPFSWRPSYGLKWFNIPVVFLQDLNSTKEVHTLRLDFEAPTNPSYWSSKEWKIEGISRNTIVIGCSQSSAQGLAVLLEVARSLELLVKSGWKPYRSILLVAFPHPSAEIWASQYKRWLRKSATAFINCGDENLSSTSISSSPTLQHLSTWAADQLVDAGLLPNAYSFIEPFTAAGGMNTFLFNYQIPSISASLGTPLQQAMFTGLALINLAQDTILPFRLGEYRHYVEYSSEFNETVARFDSEVAEERLSFTREYPWYQFHEKFRAIIRRKQLNALMQRFEHHFKAPNGDHLVFSSDVSGSKTLVNGDGPLVSRALNALEKELSVVLK